MDIDIDAGRPSEVVIFIDATGDETITEDEVKGSVSEGIEHVDLRNDNISCVNKQDKHIDQQTGIKLTTETDVSSSNGKDTDRKHRTIDYRELYNSSVGVDKTSENIRNGQSSVQTITGHNNLTIEYCVKDAKVSGKGTESNCISDDKQDKLSSYTDKMNRKVRDINNGVTNFQNTEIMNNKHMFHGSNFIETKSVISEVPMKTRRTDESTLVKKNHQNGRSIINPMSFDNENQVVKNSPIKHKFKKGNIIVAMNTNSYVSDTESVDSGIMDNGNVDKSIPNSHKDAQTQVQTLQNISDVNNKTATNKVQNWKMQDSMESIHSIGMGEGNVGVKDNDISPDDSASVGGRVEKIISYHNGSQLKNYASKQIVKHGNNHIEYILQDGQNR